MYKRLKNYEYSRAQHRVQFRCIQVRGFTYTERLLLIIKSMAMVC